MSMNGPIAKLEQLANEQDSHARYAEERRFRDGGATVRYHRDMARRLREVIDLISAEIPKPFVFKGSTYVRLPSRQIVKLA